MPIDPKCIQQFHLSQTSLALLRKRYTLVQYYTWLRYIMEYCICYCYHCCCSFFLAISKIFQLHIADGVKTLERERESKEETVKTKRTRTEGEWVNERGNKEEM